MNILFKIIFIFSLGFSKKLNDWSFKKFSIYKGLQKAQISRCKTLTLLVEEAEFVVYVVIKNLSQKSKKQKNNKSENLRQNICFLLFVYLFTTNKQTNK